MQEVTRMIGDNEQLEKKYIGFNKKIVRAFETLLDVVDNQESSVRSAPKEQVYEPLSNYYP